jgi:cyclophilin family peptidyl-prolyl cis-trans isomerase
MRQTVAMSENGSSGVEEVAVLHTNLGDITVGFFPDKAPKHVEAFKKLVADGFYDGTRFHRVIPGFMIQGGDPNSKTSDRRRHGTGGPGYTLPAEFNDIKHERGILSAARTSDPNSAGSQFFLMVKASPHLDRQYSVFGQVLDGMDVVDKIVALKRDQNDNPLEENPAIIEKATLETKEQA